MKSMSFAKTAVFIDFQPIRCGFLVFTADIIPSFAFGTGQSNCDAHAWHLLNEMCIRDRLKGVHGLASDLVECEAKIRPAVDFLLNSVVITEDMEVALAAAKALKYRVSVVTIDGDMVNPGASISGGSRNKKNGGLLDKKSRLAEAKAEQERLTHELAKYEDAMQQLRRLVNDGNARSEQIRAQLSAISEQISEIDHQLDQFAFTKEARKKRLAAIIAERASLESESIGIDGELEMLEQEYQECLTNKGAVETEIASIGDQLAELEKMCIRDRAQAAAAADDDAIVIGADTIVSLDGVIFGKPVDRADAKRMLETLSGNTHKVYTGICLIDTKTHKTVGGASVCEVTFPKLKEREIEEYLDSGEPFDKALSLIHI